MSQFIISSFTTNYRLINRKAFQIFSSGLLNIKKVEYNANLQFGIISHNKNIRSNSSLLVAKRQQGKPTKTNGMTEKLENNVIFKNMLSDTNQHHNTVKTEGLNIFKRFKEAYKNHGKVLIAVHLTTCSGWIVGFYMLAKGGFDIMKLFSLLEYMHIMSHETSVAIENKINNFNLENFLRNYHFNYVLSDSTLNWIGQLFNGVTLRNMITAVMIYKILTPLRYLTTLGVTKFMIDILKKRGVIPIRPPPGSSIKELYEEQKLVLRGRIKIKRDQYRLRNAGGSPLFRRFRNKKNPIQRNQ